MSEAVFLKGVLAVLSPMSREDYQVHYQRWINDREVVRYLVRGTQPMSVESMGRLYDAMEANPGEFELCVRDAKSGAPIGITGLHSIQAAARSAEFRVLLGEKDFWGRGIGREVLQLMVAYGMEMLNLNKVWLGVSTENQRALRSYLNCGFIEEGTLRQEVFRNGRYYDVRRMSMLRDEYLQRVEQWPTFTSIQTQLRPSA